MARNPNKIRSTRSDRIFDVCNYIFLSIVGILVLYPLYFVLIASISDPNAVNNGQVVLYPVGFSLEGYQKLFEDSRIWVGYRNTIFYTVLGTALNLLLTLITAYPLSRKDLAGKKIFTFYFLFTMFFNGGLIPTYLQVSDLGLWLG